MNTDDRVLADLIARLRKGPVWSNDEPIGSVVGEVNGATMNEAADRLEAFHAKPDRDDIERDVRIAIWNAGMKGGMGQDLSQAFIVRAMAEPTMVCALAALQSPPPVVEEGRREAAIGAAYLAIYGDGMDPLEHPEGWEYATTIADAILALTPVEGVGETSLQKTQTTAERVREACAKVAEAYGGDYESGTSPVCRARRNIAAAIRSLPIGGQ